MAYGLVTIWSSLLVPILPHRWAADSCEACTSHLSFSFPLKHTQRQQVVMHVVCWMSLWTLTGSTCVVNWWCSLLMSPYRQLSTRLHPDLEGSNNLPRSFCCWITHILLKYDFLFIVWEKRRSWDTRVRLLLLTLCFTPVNVLSLVIPWMQCWGAKHAVLLLMKLSAFHHNHTMTAGRGGAGTTCHEIRGGKN